MIRTVRSGSNGAGSGSASARAATAPTRGTSAAPSRRAIWGSVALGASAAGSASSEASLPSVSIRAKRPGCSVWAERSRPQTRGGRVGGLARDSDRTLSEHDEPLRLAVGVGEPLLAALEHGAARRAGHRGEVRRAIEAELSEIEQLGGASIDLPVQADPLPGQLIERLARGRPPLEQGGVDLAGKNRLDPEQLGAALVEGHERERALLPVGANRTRNAVAPGEPPRTPRQRKGSAREPSSSSSRRPRPAWKAASTRAGWKLKREASGALSGLSETSA